MHQLVQRWSFGHNGLSAIRDGIDGIAPKIDHPLEFPRGSPTAIGENRCADTLNIVLHPSVIGCDTNPRIMLTASQIRDEHQEIELIIEMLIEARCIVFQWQITSGEIFYDGQDKYVVVVYLRVRKGDNLIKGNTDAPSLERGDVRDYGCVVEGVSTLRGFVLTSTISPLPNPVLAARGARSDMLLTERNTSRSSVNPASADISAILL